MTRRKLFAAVCLVVGERWEQDEGRNSFSRFILGPFCRRRLLPGGVRCFFLESICSLPPSPDLSAVPSFRLPSNVGPPGFISSALRGSRLLPSLVPASRNRCWPHATARQEFIPWLNLKRVRVKTESRLLMNGYDRHVIHGQANHNPRHLQRNSGVASFSSSLSLYSHLLYLDLDTTLPSPAARLFKSTHVSSSVSSLVPHPYPPRSEMPNQSIPWTPILCGFFYFSPSNNSSNRAFSWCSVSCVSFPLVDDGGVRVG